MAALTDFVDFSQLSLQVTALSIAFNPIFWNIVARTEYRNHFLTRIFGSPYYGCYFLAFTIFSLGILRDHLYQLALADQPYYAPVHQPILGAVLFGVGSVLVLSSMYALGVTGTYLGDYFGILMDAPVTGFPFNVTGSPMYWGSTLNFLGVALYHGKVAGIALTAEVFILYWFALQWEDPFTAGIYAKRERERAKQAGKSQ
ncbi:bifunctional phosphatidyl-N-methylethanolamine N-methyltransferase/phosphatidyl-N-dimethylethanolamine N-methyltransferase [Aspergillus chevalieri]|uniref:Phosphatidyl-N-methylethanolamine N-methyltransferase n=1 Tax=Aspergillus chevalieri TaxID=182096 RepID=A0A7R7ZLN0_ASPCH|nr:phosphatidyl-N-methylethanolamine N-methyltransferase [Aspergillus chevalieri]BCR86990.1 phosphatidyl-N-methylethanolamine N-methyltransferase [Aspergillus chevalieri]